MEFVRLYLKINQLELQSLFTEERKVVCRSCSEGLTGKIKQCYACANGLTGHQKNNFEDWECECSTWECRCKLLQSFYCPLCKTIFSESEHLKKSIDGERRRWFANMITHYRHHHIQSWNRMWNKSGGAKYQTAAHFGDYDVEKEKINERAKRQIIRKCKEYLKLHQFTADDFRLQGTDKMTEALIAELGF